MSDERDRFYRRSDRPWPIFPRNPAPAAGNDPASSTRSSQDSNSSPATPAASGVARLRAPSLPLVVVHGRDIVSVAADPQGQDERGAILVLKEGFVMLDDVALQKLDEARRPR